MRIWLALTIGVLALALVGSATRAARADPVADFYRGKDVRLIISASVGGGYDVYARAVAKHLGDSAFAQSKGLEGA